MGYPFFHFCEEKWSKETIPYTGHSEFMEISTKEPTVLLPCSGDRYKLIAAYNNGKVTRHQLYDLVNDMLEKVDLSIKHLSLGEKLLNEIENWRNSVMNSAQKVGCLINS